MTLDTRVLIQQPVDPQEVFTFCRELVGANEATAWSHTPVGEDKWWLNNSYWNRPGQGLCALLSVNYGPNDGPLLESKYDEDGVKEVGVGPHDPVGFVEVSFDTAYGYQGPGGLTCGELHAGLVARLGRWCEERGLSYLWQNEYSGEWFPNWRNAADELGAPTDAALEWFNGTVLPALEAAGAQDASPTPSKGGGR